MTKVTYENSKNLIMVHRKEPDIQINRDTLQIYLDDFKKSIFFLKKDNLFVMIVKYLFLIVVFFTNDFKGVFGFSSEYTLNFYLIFAVIYLYNEAEIYFKHNESRHKISDPEKMAKLIQENSSEK